MKKFLIIIIILFTFISCNSTTEKVNKWLNLDYNKIQYRVYLRKKDFNILHIRYNKPHHYFVVIYIDPVINKLKSIKLTDNEIRKLKSNKNIKYRRAGEYLEMLRDILIKEYGEYNNIDTEYPEKI